MGCFGGRAQQIPGNKEQKKASKKIEKSLEEDKKKYNSTHRLLLLGKFAVCILFIILKDKSENFQKFTHEEYLELIKCFTVLL